MMHILKILRLSVDNHKINLWLYNGGKLALNASADTIAELMDKLSPDEETFSNLSGIYVYRGLGGYSKLRSIWAFAYGLSYPKTPVQGYINWTSRLAVKVPRNTRHSIIYGNKIK